MCNCFCCCLHGSSLSCKHLLHPLQVSHHDFTNLKPSRALRSSSVNVFSSVYDAVVVYHKQTPYTFSDATCSTSSLVCHTYCDRDYKSTDSSSPRFPADVDANLKLLQNLNHHNLKPEAF
ncbi:hypothetical protein F2Q69_00051222 [Brassica cretica]|uniref:Uncharacterized protein n=1 Tax=Brassica cretica TaxID=69181 RepID=A0A8S9Q236_BRACR|nr:hypothetical protein F2Q69_00051222 [Brassica cretica]